MYTIIEEYRPLTQPNKSSEIKLQQNLELNKNAH